MNISHGFFISDEEFIINKKGLIQYLSEKINSKLMCIYCGNTSLKDFKNAASVKNHMIGIFNLKLRAFKNNLDI